MQTASFLWLVGIQYNFTTKTAATAAWCSTHKFSRLLERRLPTALVAHMLHFAQETAK